jgi:ribulose-phosphate 3-epimerase
VRLVADAGANAIVAGSGVFKGGDYAGNITAIRQRAHGGGA